MNPFRRHAVPLLLVLLGLAACAAPPPAPQPPPQPVFSEQGDASWYGKDHQGNLTANGERFDMQALTAAHRTLPFNTMLRVTNLDNGRMVKVRINDRGPYAQGRIIDLSAAAAKALGLHEDGVVPVRLEVFAADQPPP